MRAAPPVAVRCCGGRAWRAVQALLPALAALACGAWLCTLSEVPVWYATPAVAGAGWAGWRWPATRPVRLAWDGSRWLADDCEGVLSVMVDLASWMLLRMHVAGTRPSHRPRWIAVSAAEAGPAWHALRVAAHAQAGAPTAAAARGSGQARG